MKVKTITMFGIAALLASAAHAGVSADGSHDCCDYATCGSIATLNHAAETFHNQLDPDSCINVDATDHDVYCYQGYGLRAFVAIDDDLSSMGWCAYSGDIACGTIWCPNGSGGWTTKYVRMSSCGGHLQADSSGITCFTDNNHDDRFSPGDTMLSHAGC